MEEYPNYNVVMTKLKEHNTEAYVALQKLETDAKAAEACNFEKDIRKPQLVGILVWDDTEQGYDFWDNAAMDIGERKRPVITDPIGK
jgi:hypothetical protein